MSICCLLGLLPSWRVIHSLFFAPSCSTPTWCFSLACAHFIRYLTTSHAYRNSIFGVLLNFTSALFTSTCSSPTREPCISFQCFNDLLCKELEILHGRNFCCNSSLMHLEKAWAFKLWLHREQGSKKWLLLFFWQVLASVKNKIEHFASIEKDFPGLLLEAQQYLLFRVDMSDAAEELLTKGKC